MRPQGSAVYGGGQASPVVAGRGCCWPCVLKGEERGERFCWRALRASGSLQAL